MRPPNDRIKVAHIVTLLELGGAQQNTLYTVQTLDRSRFEAILLCGRGAFLDREASTNEFPVFFVNTLVRPIRPLQDLFAVFEMMLILRREKPDVVHTHSSKAGILGRWAAWLAGVPVIVHTYHGFGFTAEQKWLTRRIYVFLEKLTAPLSTALITVSKSNRTEARALGIGRPAQYHLIRSGVSLGLYRSLARRPNAPEGIALKPEHRLITTIGPFKPQKNLMDFVAAAAIVHERAPLARFLIVGDGAQRSDLENLIRQKGLTDIVILAGWRRDVPAILMRTFAFVMTSLWEGLPRSLVEAMAAGLPSVCNAVDGVKDILMDGENGYLIPPKRPEQTAQKILYLLDNPEAAIQMGRRARESVDKEFDIDHMVWQQENLYEQLLRAKNPRFPDGVA